METKSPKFIFFGMLFLLPLAVFFYLKFGKTARETGSKGETIYTSVAGSKESCVTCHQMERGFSKYHDPKQIGCVSCHLGDPQETDKDKSHYNMVLVPGNLKDADATCGKCHVNELKKLNNSLMTTNSGLIAVDKFIFGEADSPDEHYHVKDIAFGKTDMHLRSLCLNCHLGAEKHEYGPIDQLSRGGGCTACHLNYSDEAHADLKEYLSSGKEKLPKVHPATDIFVNDLHCFGCHSRSSRISTNYIGFQETLLEKEDLTKEKNLKAFEDGRIYRYRAEDVHHTKGLLCVDCHSSHEVMGDGKKYLHEEQAVKITCSDCHYKVKPETMPYDSLDAESALVFLHRDYQHREQSILKVKKDGHPLVNSFVNKDGDLILLGKGDGKEHPVVPQGESCARDRVHNDLTCSSCHSQWTNRCIGCHNTFERNSEMAYDLLAKKEVKDRWVEHVFEFGAGLPSLGVRENKEGRKIEPAIPGMILTIDHQSFDEKDPNGTTFHRLYAPNSPHTTSKEVRSCASCHTDPSALGYGEGTLHYQITNNNATWRFEPAYDKNPNDSLPEDAWIGFMDTPKSEVFSTRSDFRPFSVKEQKRILLVGACLQCHKEDSEIMRSTLTDGLGKVMKGISKKCILPSD